MLDAHFVSKAKLRSATSPRSIDKEGRRSASSRRPWSLEGQTALESLADDECQGFPRLTKTSSGPNFD